MKLTRINNPDGTYYYINQKTGEKIDPKEVKSTDIRSVLSFFLFFFGFICLIGGIILGISKIKESASLGIALIISAIVTSITLFALSRILIELGIIKGKLKNQN